MKTPVVTDAMEDGSGYVEAGGQLSCVDSLLPPCGSHGSSVVFRFGSQCLHHWAISLALSFVPFFL